VPIKKLHGLVALCILQLLLILQHASGRLDVAHERKARRLALEQPVDEVVEAPGVGAGWVARYFRARVTTLEDVSDFF